MKQLFKIRDKEYSIGFIITCLIQGLAWGIGFYASLAPYSWGSFVRYVLQITFFGYVSVFIWIEKERLADFHIDRLMLWIMVLTGTFFHNRLGITNEIFLQALLWAPSGSILVFLILQRKNVPQTSLRWILMAIPISLISLLLLIFAKTIQPSFLSNYTPPPNINIVLAGLKSFTFQMCYVAPMEEFIFRGLSWGYLIRIGWSEKRVFWSQTIFFWIAHMLQIWYQPLSFFIVLPVTIYLYGFLVLRSKRLFPSILAHALVNTNYGILYYFH